MAAAQQQSLFARPHGATVPVVRAADALRPLRAEGNVLVSRTMMLAELGMLLGELPGDATAADYERAVKADNILRKTSAMNRAKTSQLLRNLYGLDPARPMFRALRRLWNASPEGRPVLALLQAYAREPYLRSTWPVVRDLPIGARINSELLENAIRTAAAGKLGVASLRATARNVGATWTDAGYLVGVYTKTRVIPKVSPAVVAFALFLGFLDGRRGHWLFATPWTDLLQTDADAVAALATAASQQGLLHMLKAGDVIEVRFPGWLTPDEEEQVREQA